MVVSMNFATKYDILICVLFISDFILHVGSCGGGVRGVLLLSYHRD